MNLLAVSSLKRCEKKISERAHACGTQKTQVSLPHLVFQDFRNYQYTLPVVRGLVVDMEVKKTTIKIPSNRYNEVRLPFYTSEVSHAWSLTPSVGAADEGAEQVQRPRAGHGRRLQPAGRLPPGVHPERRRQLPDAGHQHPPPASQRCPRRNPARQGPSARAAPLTPAVLPLCFRSNRSLLLRLQRGSENLLRVPGQDQHRGR